MGLMILWADWYQQLFEFFVSIDSLFLFTVSQVAIR